MRHYVNPVPKIIPQAELDTVLVAVGRFPRGASVEDIRASSNIDLPRRTLQRRLALLVRQNRLLAEGAGRGCRYRLPTQADPALSPSRRAVKKDDALRILSGLKPELARRFGVTRLALFGSTARNAGRPDSDIDVVVAFDGPATSKRYFGVQFFLEDRLGRTVDLVTEKAMRAELRPYIEREAVDV